MIDLLCQTKSHLGRRQMLIFIFSPADDEDVRGIQWHGRTTFFLEKRSYISQERVNQALGAIAGPAVKVIVPMSSTSVVFKFNRPLHLAHRTQVTGAHRRRASLRIDAAHPILGESRSGPGCPGLALPS